MTTGAAVFAVITCVATTTSPSSARADTTENKAVVMKSVEALWSRGDLTSADALYDSTFVSHNIVGPEWRGIEGIKDAVRRHRSAFPDWRERVEDIIAEGDRVVIRFTATGTQRGAFVGIAPTNRHVTVKEMSIYRLVNGKIVEQWGMPDVFGLQTQLRSSVASSDRH